MLDSACCSIVESRATAHPSGQAPLPLPIVFAGVEIGKIMKFVKSGGKASLAEM